MNGVGRTGGKVINIVGSISYNIISMQRTIYSNNAVIIKGRVSKESASEARVQFEIAN